MLSKYFTRGRGKACWPVSGFMPPAASVAPITAVDEHGALLKIELQRLLDARADHAEIEHQVSDRAVAVARHPLGHEDGVVDVDFASAIAAEHGAQPADAIAAKAAGKTGSRCV
jgi:hypothetical protein